MCFVEVFEGIFVVEWPVGRAYIPTLRDEAAKDGAPGLFGVVEKRTGNDKSEMRGSFASL